MLLYNEINASQNESAYYVQYKAQPYNHNKYLSTIIPFTLKKKKK